MNYRELIEEHYGDTEEIVFADGFDDAIIGFEPNLWRVVYSREKVFHLLMVVGMTESESVEYAEYNVFGAYVGENTPLWVEEFKW